VAKLGKKHFVMEYLAMDQEGDALASGETTMVMFDYVAQRSKIVPPDVVAAIKAHEGAGLS
jgi:acyl-CoA thioesterase FadM